MSKSTKLTEEEKKTSTPESEEIKNVPETKTAATSAKDTPADRKSKKKKNKAKKPELTEEEKAERAKKKPKDTKKAAKRLLKYLTKKKGWMFAVAALVVLTSVISVVSTLAMEPIYKILENVVRGRETSAENAMSGIIMWIVVMSVACLFAAAFSFLYTRILLSVSLRIVADLRRDLFNHLQHLPVSYFDKRKTGEIMSHFISDVSRISDLVSSDFPSIISSTITAVMTITIMIVYSWKITLTITFAIVLMVLVVMVITSKCAPLFKKAQEATAKCNGYVEEYVRGIKAVKIFCYEERSKKQFKELNEDLRRTGVKSNIIGGLMSPLISMIMRINYAIAVSFGAWLVIVGQMDAARLIVYLSFAKSYGSPIASIASSYNSFVAALAGAERIFEVLDTDVETDEGKVTLVKAVKDYMGKVTESEDGDPYWAVPAGLDGTEYVPVSCDIDIKDITFSYVEGTPVLKNVSAHANSGEKLAFVGSTGAGKTTISSTAFMRLTAAKSLLTAFQSRTSKKPRFALRWHLFFRIQGSSPEPSRRTFSTAALTQRTKRLLPPQSLPMHIPSLKNCPTAMTPN